MLSDNPPVQIPLHWLELNPEITIMNKNYNWIGVLHLKLKFSINSDLYKNCGNPKLY